MLEKSLTVQGSWDWNVAKFFLISFYFIKKLLFQVFTATSGSFPVSMLTQVVKSAIFLFWHW